jgi:hypothetical protein
LRLSVLTASNHGSLFDAGDKLKRVVLGSSRAIFVAIRAIRFAVKCHSFSREAQSQRTV